MTRIFSSVVIDRPVATVFEFVTTPGNWPQWHPSSLGVIGAIDHSLVVGEQCVETFFVAGRHGRARWTVTERETPFRWVIEGHIEGRQHGGGQHGGHADGGHANGTITYALKPATNGTRFEREFIYPTPNWFFRLMDALVIRRRVRHESEKAVQQLKAVLEQPAEQPAL